MSNREIELDVRASGYLEEFRLRDAYNQALTEQAMAALNPVFDREATHPTAREQLKAILLGKTGRIQVSAAAVQALSEARLLDGFQDTSKYLNYPGWRDLNEDGKRFSSYVVFLPTREHPKSQDLELVLSAEEFSDFGGIDFTRWVLQRPF